jgi:uncharacterized protein involved in exopolysaccharide biosynthesis
VESTDRRDKVDVIDAIWKGKWIVIGSTVIFAILAVVIAISLPNIYRSETLLAPVTADSTSSGGLAGLAGQFGGLASIAGISLGGVKTDKTALAMEYLRSRTFLMDFIERHDLKIPLMAASGWDSNSDKLEIDPDIYDVNSKQWVRVVEPPKMPEPSSWEAYEVFLELMTLERDSASGLVTLSLEYYSPSVAQQWINWLVTDLNDFMRKKDKDQAVKSTLYLQEQVQSTPLVGMQEVLFGLIEEQLKTTMLAEVRDEYAFSYVDPPFVPEQKYKPRRAIIAIVGTFTGGLLGCFLVLVMAIRRTAEQ